VRGEIRCGQEKVRPPTHGIITYLYML
jgi:hypothetical protein